MADRTILGRPTAWVLVSLICSYAVVALVPRTLARPHMDYLVLVFAAIAVVSSFVSIGLLAVTVALPAVSRVAHLLLLITGLAFAVAIVPVQVNHPRLKARAFEGDDEWKRLKPFLTRLQRGSSGRHPPVHPSPGAGCIPGLPRPSHCPNSPQNTLGPIRVGPRTPSECA